MSQSLIIRIMAIFIVSGGDGKLFKKFEAGLNPMKVVLAQKDNI